MTTTFTPESYWCTSEPNIQRAWSPSSLSTLMTCPRKYYYEYIIGYRSPNKSAANFGTIFHQALNAFDKARFEGKSFDQASALAFRTAVEDSKNFVSTEKERTQATLLRSVIWHIEAFKGRELRAITLPGGDPAIELSFKLALPIKNPDGDSFILTGYLDMLADLDGLPTVIDRKTTKYYLNPKYFSQFDVDIQPSMYILAASINFDKPFTSMLIESMQTLVNFSRSERYLTDRNPGMLDEFLHLVIWWIKQAEKFAAESYWPQNLGSCNNYGGCPFRKYCSKSPEVRDNLLASDGSFIVNRRVTTERILV